MRDIDEQQMDRYRFAAAKESSFEDVASDIKEPTSTYRKRDHAVTKEIARYKYEAVNQIKDLQRKKLNSSKPVFYADSLDIEDPRSSLTVNSSFQAMDSINEKAFHSMDYGNILNKESEGDELIKDNNRSHLHYLDAHRDGMGRRSSKNKLPKLAKNNAVVKMFRIKPLKNPILVVQADGTEYPIENTEENRVLVKISQNRDFYNLNVWARVQDVKRHYKRIQNDRRHRRRIERQAHLDKVLKEKKQDQMFTNEDEDEDSEIVELEDSESDEEDVKRQKEQEIIDKVLAMRGSKNKSKQASIDKSRRFTDKSNTFRGDRVDTEDHKTSERSELRRPIRVDSMKSSILRGNSFMHASINEPVKEVDIEVEANDIVLDLPRTSIKHLSDMLGNTQRDSIYSYSNKDSPGMTRAQQHQAKLSRKIKDLNKFRNVFEERHMHEDSSKKLKYEYELTKPMNPRHFRNLIDEPQYLRKKKRELKDLEAAAKAIMNESIENSAFDLPRLNGQSVGLDQSALYNSVVEYREKHTQSTLQTMAEKSMHHYSNNVNKRAEHNYNTFKRNKMGPKVTNSMLSGILNQISLDFSKL